MNTDKIDPSKTSTELTDEQLNEVTGGCSKTSDKPREYIKITMSNIIVSDY